MPISHTAHVSIEEINSQCGTHGVIGDPMRTLFETWCDHELQWVLHETNAPQLWTQLGRHLSGYLATFWLTGALKGDKPGEAFFVTCDQSTMTPADITAGRLICLVGLASVKPAVFGRCRIKIQLQTPGTSPRMVLFCIVSWTMSCSLTVTCSAMTISSGIGTGRVHGIRATRQFGSPPEFDGWIFDGICRLHHV